MKRHSLKAIVLALIIALLSAGVVYAEIIPPYGEGQIGLISIALCDGLVLRQEPNEAAEAVDTLQRGDRPIVMRQEDGWAYCALGDSEESPIGWISLEGLLVDPAWYRPNGKTPVYAWNDEAAPKVALLDAKADQPNVEVALPILKDEGEWILVSLNGGAGWIHANAAK